MKRILVAGIGNIFFGDDGFGVAVAAELKQRKLPPGVDVVDFGIRGMDLACAMQDERLEVLVLLDAAPRGEAPGTLSVLEPDLDGVAPRVDAHGMDPVSVLALARELGGERARPLPRTLVVCCEPRTSPTGEEEEIVIALSEPVQAALDPAVVLVEELLQELAGQAPPEGDAS
jgi:hydrogenase maturation protease